MKSNGLTPQEEFKHMELAEILTDAELDTAYSRASILGLGEVCDIYLAEIDRRFKQTGKVFRR